MGAVLLAAVPAEKRRLRAVNTCEGIFVNHFGMNFRDTKVQDSVGTRIHHLTLKVCKWDAYGATD